MKWFKRLSLNKGKYKLTDSGLQQLKILTKMEAS